MMALPHGSWMCVFLASCRFLLPFGRALEDLWTAADVTDKVDASWRGAGQVRHLSGTFSAAIASSRSALVLDGTSNWHSFSAQLHRSALYDSKQLMGLRADQGKPPNAYALAYKERKGGLLDRFREDAAVQEILARIFGVKASGCKHGRARGEEVFLITQNATMLPDAFHSDICDNDVPDHRGITVLTYPHDTWRASWAGHFELGSEAGGPVAGIAPMQNRSIIFDGCIEHRATNPTASSAPLRDEVAPISYHFRRVVGVGERRWWQLLPRFGFRGWRFAVSMQLRCPMLQPTKVRSGHPKDARSSDL